MAKRDLFFLNAPYVVEDGTYNELLQVFMHHPQEDEEVIKYACEQISQFIAFCMDIYVCYWCEQREDYHQFFPDETKKNDTKWKMSVYGTSIVIDDKTTNFEQYGIKNLENMVNMFKLNEKLKKVSKQKYPYQNLFIFLLDGNKMDSKVPL